MIKKIFHKIKPIVNAYHLLFAFLGAMIYRFPSNKIKVFAVTGTNGKTTTVDLIAKVFKEAGIKVAAFSSVKFEINNKEEPNLYKMTMPGRAVIQKLLRKAVNENCQIAVMEVTSEGIKQHRHRFIKIDTACFTNLSPEHIESHGGFEKYRDEKGKLFKSTKKAHIINIDDESAKYFLGFESREKIMIGIENDDADIVAKEVFSSKEGVSFSALGEDFFLSLQGKFNVYNALIALALARKEKINIEKVKKALKEAKGVPGRMEIVVSSPFYVVVDYAVTPVTLEGVYKEIEEIYAPEKIIAVFGSCGGGRDKWKRPVMGEIAAKYCKKIVLTNEDPYEEDPAFIVKSIKEGILKAGFSEKNLYEIIDRREAIKKGMSLAGPKDLVIVTGKGNEPWMCVAGGKKIPWNEGEIIKEEIENLKKENKI